MWLVLHGVCGASVAPEEMYQRAVDLESGRMRRVTIKIFALLVL